MRIIVQATTVAAVAFLGSFASAQFTAIGPFTGTASEGFETQDLSGGAFPTCVVDRVFTDQAELCGLNGGFAHITGGWGFGCTIQEHGGSRLFGGNNHPLFEDNLLI